MDPILTPMGPVAPKTLIVAGEAVAWMRARGTPIRNLWGYDPNAANVEHHSGRAIDFMMHTLDAPEGDALAEWLWSQRARYGIQHMIWRRRIRSTDPRYQPGIWVPMASRGSTTADHRDHIHLMLYPEPALIRRRDGMDYTRDQLVEITQEAILSIKWGNQTFGDRFNAQYSAATYIPGMAESLARLEAAMAAMNARMDAIEARSTQGS